MGTDGLKQWLVHCGHAWTVVLAGEALYVDFQWNWSHNWPEVEESTL